MPVTGFTTERKYFAGRRKGSALLPFDRYARTMPRDGAIIFGDLVGKLDVPEVACDKCGRNGRYAVAV